MELYVKYDHATDKVVVGPQSGMAGVEGWTRYVPSMVEPGPTDKVEDRYIEDLDAVVPVTVGTLAAASYQELRAKAYPKIGEQLDLLFHDIKNGTVDTDGGFFQALSAVKNQFPKD